MLKSWSIENFKPIVNSGELKLAPVTVLAGRNSSGKSSLLQSILMIAQTLSNQVPDRALLPNERIVQLGTFEDILSNFSGSRTITVGFELEFETEKSFASRQIFIKDGTIVRSVRISAIFSRDSGTSSSAIEASKAVVERVVLEISFEYEVLFEEIESDNDSHERVAVPLKFNFEIKRSRDNKLRRFLQHVTSDYLRLVPFSERQPSYFGELRLQHEAIPELWLVALSHFLPARSVQKFKVSERREKQEILLQNVIYQLLESLHPEELSPHPFPSLVDIDIDTPISESLRISVHGFCEENNIPKDFSGQSLRDLAYWFKSMAVSESKKNIIIADLRDRIVHDQLKTAFEHDKDAEGLEVVNNTNTEALSQAVEQITNFFTRKIRYLGPLRADPGVTQRNFAPTSELDDVGFKGEYAAVVYHYNQLAQIDWYNPQTTQVEQGTLQDALDTWARYLDVATQVRTEIAGPMGVTWKVVLKEGQKARTLPEVGVGVSQVLPILVMGLLAPPNTLLIIEQPELHLHASVQARLGDFFVGLSKCKKQCLIETHSENLVSQLRYHIVQSGGQEESGCMIYFVDQDEKGAAKFERIEISARGNILNWPSGFFDESMHQEDKITAASIRRRAKLATND